MNSQKHPNWVLLPRVPEEVYTDRQEFLEYFYQTALEARHRRSMSTVLLGKRRMGKTEIFKRVVNRLFWEQDHRDPQAVIPVYYSFPDEIVDRWEFAMHYGENFLRWYAAFRLREPGLLSKAIVRREELLEVCEARLPMSMGLKGSLNLLKFLQEKDITIPEEVAVQHPVWVSDHDGIPIAVFLDEFQNTRLPQQKFSVTGYMQEAVESLACPHFVTGSAMSILAREIIGRGALFGRFRSKPIDPMTPYWGTELALRAAHFYNTHITEEVAPVVADRCGGNPFYIIAVIQQAAEQHTALTDEDTVNKMLAVDLSSGFIWGELNDQVNRWITRINEYGITKWVLYLSALEEGDRLDLKRIRRELREREGKDVPPEVIRDVLIKLSRGDLLEYMELGGWFRKVDDPILLDFLKVWGRIEVAGEPETIVREDVITTYQNVYKQMIEYKGYLAEVFLIQILWNTQRTTLPGRYFHSPEDIPMPDFIYIDQRSKLGAGKGLEIDIFATAGIEVWIAESKWWSDQKVGPNAVEHLLNQAELVRERKGDDLKTLRIWFFAHGGFTKSAEALMREKQVLWSTCEDLNALLELAHLRPLPVLEK